MISQILHRLDKCTELLQYYTGTAVTFTEADDSINATGIGTGTFAVGDFINVGGSSEAANNLTWELTSVAANKLIVDGVITADTPGETITLNQEYIGAWVETDRWAKLVGTANTSGDCSVYIDQSSDDQGRPTDVTNTDYTTPITVTGGTAAAWSIEVVGKWARMRVRNNGADQTTMRVYLFGRAIT